MQGLPRRRTARSVARRARPGVRHRHHRRLPGRRRLAASSRSAPRSATLLGPVAGGRRRRRPPAARDPRLLRVQQVAARRHRRAPGRERQPARPARHHVRGPLPRRRARRPARRPPQRTGLALVPARVVAMGPAQSFSRTVTIDAGTSSGIHPDMTVINNDGLVGRVLARQPRHRRPCCSSSTRSRWSAPGSARTPRSASCAAAATIDGDGRLDLDLVDNSETPGQGRRRRHLGQPQRCAVRRRHPDRHRRVGVLQPARAGQARGDQPVRRLLLARPGRASSSTPTPRATAR